LKFESSFESKGKTNFRAKSPSRKEKRKRFLSLKPRPFPLRLCVFASWREMLLIFGFDSGLRFYLVKK